MYYISLTKYLKWSTDETKLIVIVSVASKILKIPQGLLKLFLSSYFYKELLCSFSKFSTVITVSARIKNVPVLSWSFLKRP